MQPSQEAFCGFLGGTISATGFPNRVTLTGAPVRRTSSNTAKHVALNLEIAISRILQLYHGQRPWSDPKRQRLQMDPSVPVSAGHMDSFARAGYILSQGGRHCQQIIRFARLKAATPQSIEPAMVSLIGDHEIGSSGMEGADYQRNERGGVRRFSDAIEDGRH
jgi:hypothetical protein